MSLKLEIQLNDPQRFFTEIFDTNEVGVGQSVKIDRNITITNMNIGSHGITASEVAVFVIENHQGIAVSITAAIIYDIVKQFAVLAVLNGKKILSKKDVEEILDS